MGRCGIDAVAVKEGLCHGEVAWFQVLEQERQERMTCRRAAEYDRVTFGDMVRGVTDEGDFDDHFSAEDYDRRRYQRDGWGTVPGDRWV